MRREAIPGNSHAPNHLIMPQAYWYGVPERELPAYVPPRSGAFGSHVLNGAGGIWPGVGLRTRTRAGKCGLV